MLQTVNRTVCTAGMSSFSSIQKVNEKQREKAKCDSVKRILPLALCSFLQGREEKKHNLSQGINKYFPANFIPLGTREKKFLAHSRAANNQKTFYSLSLFFFSKEKKLYTFQAFHLNEESINTKRWRMLRQRKQRFGFFFLSLKFLLL